MNVISKEINIEERNNGIIFKQNLSKSGKEVFVFNQYIDGRWQVVGNVPLNVAKKIYFSSLSKYVWIEGRESNLDPDKYATISDEQWEIFSERSGKKNFSVPDFVYFSKRSGYPLYIKSYDLFSEFDLKLFIKVLEDNDLVD